MGSCAKSQKNENGFQSVNIVKIVKIIKIIKIINMEALVNHMEYQATFTWRVGDWLARL